MHNGHEILDSCGPERNPEFTGLREANMETTRHFVATVYVVHEGATALHEHDRLGLWLPPGGHLARDELPHEAARREVREELGLDVSLIAHQADVTSSTVESLPQPHHFLLEDINVHGDQVGHQHIDFVYYGSVASRDISPREGEAPASAWQWYDRSDLESNERLPTDVQRLGIDAIETVQSD